MAKRGPKPQEGLLWHKAKRMWYKVIDGRQKRFGMGESKDDLGSCLRAEAEYKRFLLNRLQDEIGDAAHAGHAVIVENGELTKLPVSFDQIKRLLAPDASVRDTVTCQAVVDAYLEYLEKEASQPHYLDAKGRLPIWLDFVGKTTPATQLTHEHFVAFRDRINRQVRDGTLSQHSANKVFTLVKGALTAAGRERGYAVAQTREYAKILRSKKTEPTDREILSPDDVVAMLAAFDLKWKAITLLALNAALSNTDVAFLTWGSINWEGKYLDYTRGKTKGVRRTPLWARTIKTLHDYRQSCPKTGADDLVFPNKNGVCFIAFTDKSKNDNLSRAFRKRSESLGFDHSFATFRKSASTAAKMHVDEGAVTMLLGDAATKVWRRYAMAVPDVLRKATAGIEAYYFPKKKPDKK